MALRHQTIPRSSYIEDPDDDEEDQDEAENLDWVNIIFLPFHPVFRLVVLISVILRINLTAIEALYPIYCSDVMNSHVYLIVIKHLHEYFCDIIYGVDTLLHIIHRSRPPDIVTGLQKPQQDSSHPETDYA
ncbi:uncharacterized protein LOC125230427 [Leguminivora glycinivorella]|uniref:uncharacterized protein LOC125230427 n=1 Tax=Leguminivora glycinivorella TaxID=1035111 RepID=UPI00200BCF00|nr:uncharacterized protein LOC125230427 [Leguminivora glycinivorella]